MDLLELPFNSFNGDKRARHSANHNLLPHIHSLHVTTFYDIRLV